VTPIYIFNEVLYEDVVFVFLGLLLVCCCSRRSPELHNNGY